MNPSGSENVNPLGSEKVGASAQNEGKMVMVDKNNESDGEQRTQTLGSSFGSKFRLA